MKKKKMTKQLDETVRMSETKSDVNHPDGEDSENDPSMTAQSNIIFDEKHGCLLDREGNLLLRFD
ncbi:MAG: hypothetical protein J6P72_08620 [Firmicutes bacterium]|nr:hypothetical protein [Bacillota bacterium]